MVLTFIVMTEFILNSRPTFLGLGTYVLNQHAVTCIDSAYFEANFTARLS